MVCFTPHRGHVPPSLVKLFIIWGPLLVGFFFVHDLTLSSCFRCQKPARTQQGQAMAESPKACSLILRPLLIIKVVLGHGKAIPRNRLKTQARLLTRKTSRQSVLYSCPWDWEGIKSQIVCAQAALRQPLRESEESNLCFICGSVERSWNYPQASASQ